MTVLMSGINMYSMAVVMKVILGWNINFSILVSTATVGIYVALGGLLSAIVNEVVQFVLIWAGTISIPILGLIETGGWHGMLARIATRAPLQDYTHMWRNMGAAADNPMGVHWTGIVFGLGLTGAFGYWTTDFLVVQRVMAARDLRSAKIATTIGAAFKMLLPAIVILPGLLGLAGLPMKLTGEMEALATGGHSYNKVMPLMMARYLGSGFLASGNATQSTTFAFPRTRVARAGAETGETVGYGKEHDQDALERPHGQGSSPGDISMDMPEESGEGQTGDDGHGRQKQNLAPGDGLDTGPDEQGSPAGHQRRSRAERIARFHSGGRCRDLQGGLDERRKHHAECHGGIHRRGHPVNGLDESDTSHRENSVRLGVVG